MKSLLFAALSATSLLACAVDTDTNETEQSSSASTELNWTHKNVPKGFTTRGGTTGHIVLLTNHGGRTVTNAHVVPLFWGPYWGSGAGATQASDIIRYIGAYGTSGEYNVITQYSGIQKSNLAGGNAAWFDSSVPPTNATDAIVQGEVNNYLSSHSFDANAIYEVFLPPASYSSDGTSTSCGGPHLAYCAYHGNYTGANGDTLYASMPYPSCSGCQGFTSDTQNIEHFISHETREAVTDPDGTGWWDRSGNEADDKCAWSPTPFADATVGTNSDGTGFGYQYEWSNANSGCVKTR